MNLVMSYEAIKKHVEQKNIKEKDKKNKLDPAKETNLEALKKEMMERDDEHGRISTLSGKGGNGFDIAPPMIDEGR